MSCLCLRADNAVVVAGSDDGAVRCFDTRSGKMVFTASAMMDSSSGLPGHAASAVSMSAGGELLTYGDASGVVRVYDVRSKRPVLALQAHWVQVGGWAGGRAGGLVLQPLGAT